MGRFDAHIRDCEVANTLSSGIYRILHAHKRPASEITLRDTPSPGEPGHQAYMFIPYLVSRAATDTVTAAVFCLTRPGWCIRLTIRGHQGPKLAERDTAC